MKSAVDTSVVVAAFASWHESHDAARRVLEERPLLIAHCAVEAYSVLTRLPPPHRVAARWVQQFLAASFPSPSLTLPAAKYRELLALLAQWDVTGGTVYDALVAFTAAHHQATLSTLDRRAEAMYQRLSVRYEIVGRAI